MVLFVVKCPQIYSNYPMKKAFLILFFLINTSPIFSQEYEFTGLLKLNKTTIISYHLTFTERDGKISGISITDLGGDNETKNKIEGFYNRKTDEFSFTEKNIIYSKSKIVKNDFCYLHYKSKFKLKDQKKISGKFKSFFKDGKSCLNGEIDLIEFKKAQKKIHKMNSKIQNSKLVPKEKKDSINFSISLGDIVFRVKKPSYNSYYNQ